jgi:hypothetical protein
MVVNNKRIGLILLMGFIFLSLVLAGCGEKIDDSNIIGNYLY